MKRYLIPLVGLAGLMVVACNSGSGSGTDANGTTTTTGTTQPATTGTTAPAGTTGATAAAGGANFTTVASVATANCMPCHTADKHRGGLSLASYADIMKGGEHGPAVKGGDPDNSILIKAVSGGDAGHNIPKMPPKGNLPAADIQKIKDWIKAGAKQA